ncbi:MAG: hypothetical protein ACTSVL_03865 [Promethearchaeota archaeon]
MSTTTPKLQNWMPKLTPEAVKFTQPEIMAKFISTIDSNGYPHITLLTSNKAVSQTLMKWGEFTKGQSKGNVVKNPKHAVLYMTVKMPFRFLQAKVHLDSISLEGDDAVDFNTMALFRYNTYMRVYRVFFNKIIGASRIRNISLLGLVKGIFRGLFGVGGKTGTVENRLNTLGDKLFSGMVFPKFISYIDSDGYPIIIPVFQARGVESKRIIIPLTQFKADLIAIPKGAKVSMIAMDFETVSQMIKGTFLGIEKNKATIDIEQVYNSMPPKMGEIYPNKKKLEKITQFE